MTNQLSQHTYQLTPEQIKSYQDNGYLVVEGLFTPEESEAINQVARTKADEKFSAVMNPDRELSYLRDVMKLPRIVSILEALQGKEVVGLMSQILFKEAGSPYAPQAWNPHQDNAYPKSKGEYITINIALKPMDVENGCLYMFPGSHKEGLYPCEETVSYREIPGSNPGNTVAADVLARFPRVDLPIGQGGVLFMHGDCVHGSYPNNSNRSRPLYSISYISKGAEFIPGKNANRTAIELR